MAECTTCGGFVTDNYARVFGNNDDQVASCRSCRGGRERESTDTESGEPVLLRDIRGTDSEHVGHRAGAAGESTEPAGPADASATTADADAEGESTADRFGIDSIRSTIRSIAR